MHVMKATMFIAKTLGYAIPICLIGAFFGLDIPFSTLLNALKITILPALLVGVLLVLFQNWALKKGGVAKE